MTAHLSLGFVLHQHQPVGNFDFVFEELFEKSYEPLISALERHPGVRLGLHYSGPLIDWLTLFRPEYLDRVAALVSVGQVEIVGGAYYEPILPAIVEDDRIGQLARMRDALAERFGAAPSGAWLPERVWEPGLPTALEQGGYDWTLVDDVHFMATGLPPESLHGWRLTEADGYTVGVFGSSTALRYTIPWHPVEDVIASFRQRAAEAPGSLVVMGDDGEKFGGWPTTYKLCWEDGWVDAFFAALERESSWLETVHLGEWRRQHAADGLVYLPSASYMEMGEWALPPQGQHALERAKTILQHANALDLHPFLRGAHWRNFLVRYPEANLLQKRAMQLSRDARAQRHAEALDHVWQAECNCPYWHGVFGGVYLENIRHANFGHLTRADALLFPGPQPPEIRDWDFDGQDEAGLRSDRHFTLIAPHRTGEIVQWDLRDAGWNMTHVVALRPEAYHAGIAADADAGDGSAHNIHGEVRIKDPRVLSHELRYDHGMRVAAQDTLLPPHAAKPDYRAHRGMQDAHTVRWTAEGQAAELTCAADGREYAKRITVGEQLEVTYRGEDNARLFSEWNLSFPQAPTFEHAEGLLRVQAGALALEAVHNAQDVWTDEVFSVSNTEAGLELASQGWCIVFGGSVGPNQRPFEIRWRRIEDREASDGKD
jgi:alpha-amylase